MTADDPLRRFLDAARDEPARTAILLDFDGTLSPTVPDPASARPADGAVAVLEALARRYGTVAVVSGRPLSFLEPLLPDAITISGQYGLELHVPGGRDVPDPDPARTRAITDAVGLLTAGVRSGVLVEPKGLTITVHWRNVPETEASVRELAAVVAAETGLEVHDAKASVELRPAVGVDKGTVVEELAAEATAVIYVGDDVGDLPAFESLGAMRSADRVVLRVAVDGPELPEPVREAVDVTVDGPTGAVALLTDLIG